MIRQLFLLLIALFMPCFTASAQVLLMPGDYPDPSVLKDGDDYYMTHSAFNYLPGFLIWHSRDLLHWEPVCRADGAWTGSAWAPDLQKVGDTYYLYYPANGTNWVVTAKDIHGPWSEPIDLKIRGIDPGLIVTPEGKRYLFTSGGLVTPLTDDGLASAGETEHVYEGWEYPQEWDTECMCLESPKLTWHDGYYYLTSAEGGTAGPATSHMVVCARSKSVYGPWENSPYNPIVHTYSADNKWWSKGHGTIVEGPGGQWWVVYHAYNKDAYSLGRNTLMEPIEWTSDGWYRSVKDMTLPEAGDMPGLSDDFTGSQLGWQWTGWKENISTWATVGNDGLTLPGKGSSPLDGRLMLTTANDEQYSVEVEVWVPEKDGEAGLLLFYSEKAFAGVSCDSKNFKVYQDAEHYTEMPNTMGRRLRIRLENRCDYLDILVSGDGNEWQTLAEKIHIADFHHNRYGEFLALRPALYAGGTATSQFKKFSYQSRVRH